MPSSPARSCSEMVFATLGWLRWSLRELPRVLVSLWHLRDHKAVSLTVRAVNHHDLRQVLLAKGLSALLDVLGIVVGALCSTSEDDEAILVSGGLCDGSKTLLGNTHEVVLGSSRADSVNSNTQAAVGTVLEAHRERQTRGKLSVQLRLGGTGADGTERDEIGKELRRDGVEHFAGNGHALAGQVAEELARDAQTLVDLVALVKVGVVDQALPADSSTRLLEVSAHDDAEVLLELVGELLQTAAVFDGSVGVVERAGTDHDKKTVILLVNDGLGFATALLDGVESDLGSGDLGGQEFGRDQRVVTQDAGVVVLRLAELLLSIDVGAGHVGNIAVKVYDCTEYC